VHWWSALITYRAKCKTNQYYVLRNTSGLYHHLLVLWNYIGYLQQSTERRVESVELPDSDFFFASSFQPGNDEATEYQVKYWKFSLTRKCICTHSLKGPLSIIRLDWNINRLEALRGVAGLAKEFTMSTVHWQVQGCPGGGLGGTSRSLLLVTGVTSVTNSHRPAKVSAHPQIPSNPARKFEAVIIGAYKACSCAPSALHEPS
jgi:hypothetical protein